MNVVNKAETFINDNLDSVMLAMWLLSAVLCMIAFTAFKAMVIIIGLAIIIILSFICETLTDIVKALDSKEEEHETN